MGKGEESSAETQAHNISSRQKENRGGTKGKVGEGEGTVEEDRVELRVKEGACFADRRLSRPFHVPNAALFASTCEWFRERHFLDEF